MNNPSKSPYLVLLTTSMAQSRDVIRQNQHLKILIPASLQSCSLIEKIVSLEDTQIMLMESDPVAFYDKYGDEVCDSLMSILESSKSFEKMNIPVSEWVIWKGTVQDLTRNHRLYTANRRLVIEKFNKQMLDWRLGDF